MSMELSEFYDAFLDQAQELLQDMEAQLLALDIEHPDDETLGAIFRAAHSIKGGAATFGVFELLVQTAHRFENALEEVCRRRLTLSRAVIDIFLQVKDVLADQVAAYRDGRQPQSESISKLARELDDLVDGCQHAASSRGVSESHAARQRLTMNDEEQTLLVAVENVSDLDRRSLEAELKMVGKLVSQRAERNAHVYHLLTDVDAQTIRAICGFVIANDQVVNVKPAREESVRQTDTQRASHYRILSGKDNHTSRVLTVRVDELVIRMDQVAATLNILTQACQQLDLDGHAAIFDGICNMEDAVRSLQACITTLRMVPIEYVFGRYRRMVHEMAAKLNKQVELQTTGGETELNRELAEKLIDPLTHIIRNSIDHGIEAPAVRLVKGKPALGRISINALREGDWVVVEVVDDGAGINRERIFSKALARNVPVSPAMADSEVLQLVFAPGLSTKDAVTEISGRGVGMDIVRTNILRIGGNVQIDSKPGVGTTLKISIPLMFPAGKAAG